MAISEAMTATPRVKSIQRIALAMLVVAGVINYVDRATLAVANLLIRDDLHLSIADMGYLLSAFLWAYAFAQLPTGAMVDKLGPRLLLACGLTFGRSPSFSADSSRASASFSASGSFWAWAKRRSFRPAPASSAIGSIRATAASRPVFSTARHRLGTAIAVPLPDLPHAELRLARDVHDHGNRRSCHGGGLVCLLPQSDRSAAHGGRDSLSHAWRSAGSANRR